MRCLGQQTTTLGNVSDTQGLAWARSKAHEARSRVEEGDHPTRVKAVMKAAKRAASGNTFATVSAAWLKSEAKRANGTPDYREEVAASLDYAVEDGVIPANPIPAARRRKRGAE